jgi:hypothetical protein
MGKEVKGGEEGELGGIFYERGGESGLYVVFFFAKP